MSPVRTPLTGVPASDGRSRRAVSAAGRGVMWRTSGTFASERSGSSARGRRSDQRSASTPAGMRTKAARPAVSPHTIRGDTPGQ